MNDVMKVSFFNIGLWILTYAFFIQFLIMTAGLIILFIYIDDVYDCKLAYYCNLI